MDAPEKCLSSVEVGYIGLFVALFYLFTNLVCGLLSYFIITTMSSSCWLIFMSKSLKHAFTIMSMS